MMAWRSVVETLRLLRLSTSVASLILASGSVMLGWRGISGGDPDCGVKFTHSKCPANDAQ
jgi:hypothetical protein